MWMDNTITDNVEYTAQQLDLRCWSLLFSWSLLKHVLSNGSHFNQVKIEPCVYVKKTRNISIYLVFLHVYVFSAFFAPSLHSSHISMWMVSFCRLECKNIVSIQPFQTNIKKTQWKCVRYTNTNKHTAYSVYSWTLTKCLHAVCILLCKIFTSLNLHFILHKYVCCPLFVSSDHSIRLRTRLPIFTFLPCYICKVFDNAPFFLVMVVVVIVFRCFELLLV